MRVFAEMNTSGDDVCLICGTNENKPVVLIGVDGTEDGHTIQAFQFHVECLELRYEPNKKVIYQIVGEG